MKKNMTVMLVAITVISVCCAWGEENKGNAAKDKLGRGLVNVLVSPLEISEGIKAEYKKNGPAMGFTYGLTKGTMNALKRMGAGFVETVTFPAPLPKKGYGPLIPQGEFFGKMNAAPQEIPEPVIVETAEPFAAPLVQVKDEPAKKETAGEPATVSSKKEMKKRGTSVGIKKRI